MQLGCCELDPVYSSLQGTILLGSHLPSAHSLGDIPTSLLIFFLWEAVYGLETAQVLATRVHISGFLMISF